MAKRDKNPSKAAVSAASVKGNAGPHTREHFGKTQTTNQQYGSDSTQKDF
ncbi:YuzL family protein [Litchfieldia alkalitelluris]|nr:YuzL family protein [Litchfieldia alkalitelluris]